MFAFSLALRLGKTLDEVLDIPASEFADWQVYLSLTQEDFQAPSSIETDLMAVFGNPQKRKH